MRSGRIRGTLPALAATLGLLMAACAPTGGTATTAGGTDTTQAPPTTAMGVATDVGVTEEPCPDAVDSSKGCIYLGTLSDLTEGPFAALAVPITEGMQDFWARVNEQGGIGGAYEVNVEEYTRDNKYNPEVHVAEYREIQPNVLALAQSLGTPPSLAALPLYQEDDVVAVAVTWWSGWEFEDVMLHSGYNYCIESMNAIDWAIENHGVESVMAVGYPGDYGGDSAAGAEIGAEATGIEFMGAVETLPNEFAGNQDAPVAEILSAGADLVIAATGPGELAEIVGKAAAGGFQGRFIGSVPTWNPALLQSASGPALQALYNQVSPWGPFGTDTPAHQAMAEALGEGNVPANDGYTYGWIWSYAMLSTLQQAYDGGDLTRAGVRAAVQEATVDYEGALPDKSYSGDPNQTVVRESLITAPDPDAPLGISVVEDFFVGPTAEGFDFTEPCVAAG